MAESDEQGAARQVAAETRAHSDFWRGSTDRELEHQRDALRELKQDVRTGFDAVTRKIDDLAEKSSQEHTALKGELAWWKGARWAIGIVGAALGVLGTVGATLWAGAMHGPK